MLQAPPDSQVVMVWAFSPFPAKSLHLCQACPSTPQFQQQPPQGDTKAAASLFSPGKAHPLCNLVHFDSVCVRSELSFGFKESI